MSPAEPVQAWSDAVEPPWAAPLRAVERWRSVRQQSGWLITARMRVDAEEQNLRGHFPGMPIYPGVFVVETLSQAMTAALSGRTPRLSSVRSLRFTAPVLAGDELIMEIDARDSDGGWDVHAVGRRLDGEVTARIRAVFSGEVGP